MKWNLNVRVCILMPSQFWLLSNKYPERQLVIFLILECLTPMWNTRLNSWFLILVWISPSFCKHIGKWASSSGLHHLALSFPLCLSLYLTNSVSKAIEIISKWYMCVVKDLLIDMIWSFYNIHAHLHITLYPINMCKF